MEYPENTMEAFVAADLAGADVLETDVLLSADGAGPPISSRLARACAARGGGGKVPRARRRCRRRGGVYPRHHRRPHHGRPRPRGLVHLRADPRAGRGVPLHARRRCHLPFPRQGRVRPRNSTPLPAPPPPSTQGSQATRSSLPNIYGSEREAGSFPLRGRFLREIPGLACPTGSPPQPPPFRFRAAAPFMAAAAGRLD